MLAITLGKLGSSPLARGLPLELHLITHWFGIIPARAGFTGFLSCGALGPGDHPRSRGVYAAKMRRLSPESGSSPLARGLPERSLDETCEARIIPARAGFTFIPCRSCIRVWDHPRSRGVYVAILRILRQRFGSSPLARGLLRTCRSRHLHRRIIPARAGFTIAGRDCRASPADHPRSRGVYGDHVARPGSAWGSSPLARGLHGEDGED